MTASSLTIDTDDRGVATITLNRAVIHNAFDDLMIAELLQALEIVETDQRVRLLVLRAKGDSFSAGADLNWMRRMADYDHRQNRDDAMKLARLMKNLNQLNKPVIAVVQGASFGGGVGLVACCDIAIGSSKAMFCLSEVRLGLIPAVISPYVIAAIGERSARRYFLSAEKFNAEQALSLGLLHDVVDPEALDYRVEKMVEALLLGGPKAQSEAKQLIREVGNRLGDERVIKHTAECIARIRASSEGREGLNAFLQKRAPNWKP